MTITLTRVLRRIVPIAEHGEHDSIGPPDLLEAVRASGCAYGCRYGCSPDSEGATPCIPCQAADALGKERVGRLGEPKDGEARSVAEAGRFQVATSEARAEADAGIEVLPRRKAKNPELQYGFIECDACAEKEGAPVLCAGCLTNRSRALDLERKVVAACECRNKAEAVAAKLADRVMRMQSALGEDAGMVKTQPPAGWAQLRMLVLNHRQRMETLVPPGDEQKHETNSLQSFHNAVVMLLQGER